MAALASLTANYTDSEEEDDKKEEDVDDEVKDCAGSSTAKSIDEESNQSGRSGTVERSAPGSAVSTPPVKKKRLVSYGGGDDDDENDVTKSDEDEDEKAEEGNEAGSRRSDEKDDDVVSMELDSENNGEDDEEGRKEESAKQTEVEPGARASAMALRQSSSVEVEAWTGGVQLPPEPNGICHPHLQEKINKLYKKKMEYPNYDFNKIIQNMKSFRNPSIYEKLIVFCDIDEHGTNFPKELYDGHLFGPESYYEELAKTQAAEMEKREKKVATAKATMGKTLIKEGVKKSGDDAKQRRSKWDQPAPEVLAAAAAARTISAFGPLRK